MRRLLRLIVRIAVILAVIVFTLILVRAFDSRRQPDLSAWHTVNLTEEYRADRVGEITTWQDYLDLEDRVFDELQAKVIDLTVNAEGDFFNRYNPDSVSYPPRAGRNWNRSFELPVDGPRGVAVLVHGLTDAPYSMRAIGRDAAGRGTARRCTAHAGARDDSRGSPEGRVAGVADDRQPGRGPRPPGSRSGCAGVFLRVFQRRRART